MIHLQLPGGIGVSPDSYGPYATLCATLPSRIFTRPENSIFRHTLYGQGGLDPTSVVDGFLSRCILFDAGSTAPNQFNPMRTELPASIVEPLAAWINFQPCGEMGRVLDPQPKMAEKAAKVKLREAGSSTRLRVGTCRVLTPGGWSAPTRSSRR